MIVAGLAAGIPLLARGYMWRNARGRIYIDPSQAPKTRVALVLGAAVRPDGRLSGALRDRVDTAIKLYEAGRVEKLLMSGDNRFDHYNEPERMREYAIKKGVEPDDVKCDYAGRRTYDSLYRAKHIFGLDEIIIVSQGFHLDRLLFLADAIGIRASGVAAPYLAPKACTSRDTGVPGSGCRRIYKNSPSGDG